MCSLKLGTAVTERAMSNFDIPRKIFINIYIKIFPFNYLPISNTMTNIIDAVDKYIQKCDSSNSE